jgi:K+-sensing histidine kinase KdpD
MSKRASWAQDSVLAAFTLTLAAVSIAPFMNIFSWKEVFAILIVPTLFLCCYARYRAAAVAAGIAVLAGGWIVVPPRWSLRVNAEGALVILIFATAATLAITTSRVSQRRAGPSPACEENTAATPVRAPLLT